MNATSGSGSSGTFVWGLIAGLLALIAAGGLYMSGIFGGVEDDVAGQDAEPTVEEAAVTPSEEAPEVAEPPAPSAGEDPAAEAQTAEADTAEATPDPEPPAEDVAETPVALAPVLDQIFVEPDGNALLSGTADPGAEILVLLNGQQVHRFFVDNSGQFAEFLSIPFADDARGLVLESRDGEQAVRSDDYLIAALPAPEQQGTTVDVAEAAEEDTTPLPQAEGETGADVPVDDPADDPQVAETSEPEVAPSDAETEQVASADLATAEAEPGADAQPTDAESDQIAEAQPGAAAQDEASDPQTAEADPTPEPQAESEEQTSQQVAILRSGEEGVELVQPPSSQQQAPDQVALDTIGYSDTGEVELTGRVPDGSGVRLYLDNQLVADAPPAVDGTWRGEIEGVDPGVYTLRVDEVDPNGRVVSRLETPFKREPIEALRAADITDPEALAPPIRSVTVQRGDTLWAISRDRFGDGVLYVKLFEANRDSIRDPDLIYPGQIFTIPE